MFEVFRVVCPYCYALGFCSILFLHRLCLVGSCFVLLFFITFVSVVSFGGLRWLRSLIVAFPE